MYRYAKITTRIIALTGILFTCYAMEQFIIPFLLSIIISYTFHVPARNIEKYLRTSSTMSSLIIVLCITSTCILFGIYIIPLIKNAAMILLSKLPIILKELPSLINSFAITLHVDNLNIANAFEKYIMDFGTLLPKHIVGFLNTGVTLMYVIMYVIMTPILTFYVLKDWHKIEKYVSSMLEKFTSDKVSKITSQINKNLGQYILGQLGVCSILSCIYIISLYILGIENFVVCGIFSGMMAFAPFFGALISFITTISISADSIIGISQCIFIGCIYLIIPFVDANIITPKLIGRRVGLQPFWLLFSICATVSIIGTFGIFVSVPMAIILSTICKNMIKDL